MVVLAFVAFVLSCERSIVLVPGPTLFVTLDGDGCAREPIEIGGEDGDCGEEEEEEEEEEEGGGGCSTSEKPPPAPPPPPPPLLLLLLPNDSNRLMPLDWSVSCI